MRLPGLRDVGPEVGWKRQASGSLLSRGIMSVLAHPGGAVSDRCLFCSDGEAPGGNPMVAGFQDDLDLDDKIPSRSMLAAERVPSKNITLSSEEEEEEEVKDSKVVLIPDADINTEQEKKRYEAQPEVWGCAGKLGPLLGPAAGFCAASGKFWCLYQAVPRAVRWGCIYFRCDCFMQCFLHCV